MARSVVMSYSGGKDSSSALYTLTQDASWEVKRLLTTATVDYQRTSMHGVRLDLLEKQAAAIGLPLDVVWMNATGGADDYENKMENMLRRYKDEGIEYVAFGDLYLEDVRAYREKMNESVGMKSVFPVWGCPTKEFSERFIEDGFRAIVVCVDSTQLDISYCGREFDMAFLRDLPEGVDWCAENGEFHTFCYDGPVFKEAVPFAQGKKVMRNERFYYLDLLPVD